MATQSPGNNLVTPKKVRETLAISNNTLIKYRREHRIGFVQIGNVFRYDLNSILKTATQKIDALEVATP